MTALDDFNRTHPVHYSRPLTCWCGEMNRLADDHDCAECPQHCELAAHRDGRPSPRSVVALTTSIAVAATLDYPSTSHHPA